MTYLGQIILMASDFAPEGWMICDGRTLNVREHQALYSILSNRFGGDGIRTFALPDLRDKVPVLPSNTREIGQVRSSEQLMSAQKLVGGDSAQTPIQYVNLIYCICAEGGDYPIKPMD